MRPARPAKKVTDLADACVEAIRRATGIELDYSQETLPLLDHYVSMSREEASEDVRMLVAVSTGAYFGEVVRRTLSGGTWHCAGEAYDEWELVLEGSGLRFNPIGVGVEVVAQDDAGDWHAHFQVPPERRAAIHAILDQAGSVTPADYYCFATRFDVAEQVHEALVALRATGARQN